MGDRLFHRIFVIVIDSFGIGNAPDAAEYGDDGADTLGHIAERCPGMQLPNLRKLGLANLKRYRGTDPVVSPLGRYLPLREKSRSKDTMTGHWEMMGVYTDKPQKTFSEHGFPPELIQALEQRTGRKIIGNRAVSGTVILDELGEQEINEGKLIVYTSADSVLQICGNEETMGLKNLYHYCEIARELTMRDEWRVGRVIARPYTGLKRGEFRRTANRHDYALNPPHRTALNALEEAGLDVISVGKIRDIFNGYGITEALHSESSVHGMEQTTEICRERDFHGLCFVNLVDFDALWGHRRDPEGYAGELERFDRKLGGFMKELKRGDLMILTADHGNDPTWRGTDHTREQVPMICWSPAIRNGTGGLLPGASTFGVIGATICDNFEVPYPEECIGTSRLEDLR